MTPRKMLLALALFLAVGVTLAQAEGLLESYGKDLPTVEIKGKKMKLLRKGHLEAGDSLQINNVVFEENAKAILVGVGQGEGSDLDLFVTDAKNGSNIGSDTLTDNIPVVEWQTGAGARNTVNIRLLNAGSKAGDFMLLANW